MNQILPADENSDDDTMPGLIPCEIAPQNNGGAHVVLPQAAFGAMQNVYDEIKTMITNVRSVIGIYNSLCIQVPDSVAHAARMAIMAYIDHIASTMQALPPCWQSFALASKVHAFWHHMWLFNNYPYLPYP